MLSPFYTRFLLPLISYFLVKLTNYLPFTLWKPRNHWKVLKQMFDFSDRKSIFSNIHELCGFFRDGVEVYKEHFDRPGMKESRFPYLRVFVWTGKRPLEINLVFHFHFLSWPPTDSMNGSIYYMLAIFLQRSKLLLTLIYYTSTSTILEIQGKKDVICLCIHTSTSESCFIWNMHPVFFAIMNEQLNG